MRLQVTNVHVYISRLNGLPTACSAMQGFSGLVPASLTLIRLGYASDCNFSLMWTVAEIEGRTTKLVAKKNIWFHSQELCTSGKHSTLFD